MTEKQFACEACGTIENGNAAMSMLITVTNVDSGQSLTLPLH